MFEQTIFSDLQLTFQPWLPHWAMIGAVLLGILFGGLSLIRNWKSGALRVLAIGAMLTLLANPMQREAQTTPLSDIALILVDESASQSLDGRDRITAQAAQTLQNRLEAMDNIDVETISFGDNDETLTVSAARQAIADTPRQRLGGVFIITDGQAHDSEEAGYTIEIDAPVHILTTGSKTESDRKITLLDAPRYGIVRQSVRVSFRIDDIGPDEITLDGSPSAIVTLRVDGEEALSERVPVGVEAGFDVPLNRPGQTTIELEVATRSGELTTRNNIAVLPITAIRDRLRVLLISGEPQIGRAHV